MSFREEREDYLKDSIIHLIMKLMKLSMKRATTKVKHISLMLKKGGILSESKHNIQKLQQIMYLITQQMFLLMSEKSIFQMRSEAQL